MIQVRFVLRELRYGGAQALTFILCVALSIATLTALNSFRSDVHRSLLNDAQKLHGGDVIIHSHYPISEPLEQAVRDIQSRAGADLARVYGFNSVVRPEVADGSLFVNIMAVAPGYPLYGSVDLASGRPFGEVLQAGAVVVAPEVLSRLSLRIGDRLRIGTAVLTIVDTIDYDPSRPVSIFSLGPRIFTSTGDLEQMGLLGVGSRSHYEILLRLPEPEQARKIAETLSRVATAGQERVETATTARSQVKRFFDNMLFFLSFISIFTLLLSGIGMQSSLSALLRQKQYTIAIGKTVGATYRFLLLHYLALTMLLGLIGAIAGVLAGLIIKSTFPLLFGEIIPAELMLGVTIGDLVEGMLIGLLVVVLFSSLPLYRIAAIRPVALLRLDLTGNVGKPATYLLAALVVVFLALLVVRQLEDVQTGLVFMLGCLGFIAIIFLLTSLVLRLLRALPVGNLAMRQAFRSLFRPGNATRSIIVTLASALSVLLTIFLLEFNLVASFITSYPKDAPNLFSLDIQRGQQEAFFAAVGKEAELFPVVRGRLLSINGEAIDYERENQRRSDSLAREFNLTYRDTLLDDEIIVRGERLFEASRPASDVVEVSVLDTIAEIGDIDLGDRLVFSIQGLPMTAEVTSIRSRTKSKLYPFFYFVFAEEVLAAAPHTFFAALHLERDAIDETITRIVTALPNVSTLNVADTVVRLGELIDRLARVITFFSLFSIVAGCLILIGSVLATRLERIRDCAYYKIVGGTTRFVLSITVYENLLLGMTSSILAAAVAIVSSWLICSAWFNIAFRLHGGALVIMALTTCAAVVGIGLISSLSIVRQKPVTFLYRQNG
ncbi:ABC transporter permease [Desulfofustis glycolicus]|uniref:Putative ABC transport system permease protein n=1 Tax=Desulfofustis glycolicus DSM 9705 TaxID=1121409 RepID=A0A1M5WCC6_9BACT|nr:FtsX-like permease family protein [Desulfofustis glycolicus]MCB2217095.1 ABC transporter permease [Desulfobulbaceae bacterium]SHH85166.1 putative ABC transport system permease protein [Desulfofustis glycolicus DSM 9705]